MEEEAHERPNATVTHGTTLLDYNTLMTNVGMWVAQNQSEA